MAENIVQAAVELCWLTCVSSELNGGELTRSGGVDSLGRLMQRCLDVLPRDAPPTMPAVLIAMHCMRTFAGMASFSDAREQLQDRCARAKFLESADDPGCSVNCRLISTWAIWLCALQNTATCTDVAADSDCRQGLVGDIVQSCGLERATGAVDAALQCVIQMAASPALQVQQHFHLVACFPSPSITIVPGQTC